MKKAFAISALVVAAIALVACGGSDDNSTSTAATTTPGGTAKGGTGKANAAGGGGGGGSTLKVSADPSGAFKFDTSSLSAKAGSDTFDFTNDSPIDHNFTIETSGGDEVAATPTFAGGTKSVTADLKPGTYTFLCTIPGHAEGGMKGTLTVK
jgi:plastocyanin